MTDAHPGGGILVTDTEKDEECSDTDNRLQMKQLKSSS